MIVSLLRFFFLHGWKQVGINDIPLKLNFVMVEKCEGKAYRLVIQKQRHMAPNLDIWEGEYTNRCILNNDWECSELEIVKFLQPARLQREDLLQHEHNGFGCNRQPKSFMAQNTVFLLLTALIQNFYLKLMCDRHFGSFGLKSTSRIKAFVLRFVTVAAKWIRTSKQCVLNIHTDNEAYRYVF